MSREFDGCFFDNTIRYSVYYECPVSALAVRLIWVRRAAAFGITVRIANDRFEGAKPSLMTGNTFGRNKPMDDFGLPETAFNVCTF